MQKCHVLYYVRIFNFIISGSNCDTDIDLELQQIKLDMNQNEAGDFLQLFKTPTLRKFLLISISMFLIQQLSGGTFIQYYSQSIFEMTGSHLPPDICAIAIGLTAFISSFIIPFAVERYGRKKLLIFSLLGMSATHLPLGIYIYFTDQGVDTSKFSFIPVLTLAVNIFTYSIGMGPVPWLLPAELFPQRVKISATSLSASVNWFFSFFMTYSFGFLMFNLGLATSFWLFGCFCFVFAIYTQIIVPETKGRDAEELQVKYGK